MIFLKIKPILEKWKKVKEVFILKSDKKPVLDLIILISFLLIMAHVFGLMFYIVGNIEVAKFNKDNTWIHNDNLVNSSWSVKYVYSFYWSSSSMIAVVIYSPKTVFETTFACLT